MKKLIMKMSNWGYIYEVTSNMKGEERERERALPST